MYLYRSKGSCWRILGHLHSTHLFSSLLLEFLQHHMNTWNLSLWFALYSWILNVAYSIPKVFVFCFFATPNVVIFQQVPISNISKAHLIWNNCWSSHTYKWLLHRVFLVTVPTVSKLLFICLTISACQRNSFFIKKFLPQNWETSASNVDTDAHSPGNQYWIFALPCWRKRGIVFTCFSFHKIGKHQILISTDPDARPNSSSNW
jgi:hypothetical protein